MGNILITGAGGYVGNKLTNKVHKLLGKEFGKIIATDIKENSNKLEGVIYEKVDIRSKDIGSLIEKHNITIVVHLAAILSSADNSNRELEYDIDVNGSKNILNACLKYNVKKFVFTSSGASYGYTERNLNYSLKEKDELLGNDNVPYAYHKMLVEQHLNELKLSNPELKQFVFRVGTIIGKETDNLITDLFKKKKILSLKGYDSPFCMIWDEDLTDILVKACINGNEGIYNIAGDGALSLTQISKILNKPLLKLPAKTLKLAFSILHPLKLSKHGPVAISFLQYRPVLDNMKLKKQFQYTPQKSSLEAFEYYLKNN